MARVRSGGLLLRVALRILLLLLLAGAETARAAVLTPFAVAGSVLFLVTFVGRHVGVGRTNPDQKGAAL